jgi:hypothetical protein
MKVFDVVSDIADKAGRLPVPPQILIDSIENAREVGGDIAKIDIRFTGPLAQAQQTLFQMQPIKNGLNDLGQASVLFPNILKKVKELEMADEILDSNNFPARLVKDNEQVAEEIAAEEQQRQQMMAQQAMQGMADAYPKVTGAPEEGSPAEAIGEAI